MVFFKHFIYWKICSLTLQQIWPINKFLIEDGEFCRPVQPFNPSFTCVVPESGSVFGICMQSGTDSIRITLFGIS